MPLSTADKTRLKDHYQKQDLLIEHLKLCYENLNQQYLELGDSLKRSLKQTLLRQLKSLPSQEKLACLLVDIQNDFVLKNFGLYVEGGENTILTNMALLDAIIEIAQETPDLYGQLDIITSQDVHKLDRGLDKDAEALIKTYGKPRAFQILNMEQTELLPFAPEKAQFGLHCLMGTIGINIAAPIEERLQILKDLQCNIIRTGKMNFSGPNSGMVLKEGVDLSEIKYRNKIKQEHDEDSEIEASEEANVEESIYGAEPKSYNAGFTLYQKIITTGICGNVCVQQAAEGLKEAFPEKEVTVLDACVHYLVAPNTNYDSVLQVVLKSYQEKGITYLTTTGFRSNPSFESEANKNRINLLFFKENSKKQECLPSLELNMMQ